MEVDDLKIAICDDDTLEIQRICSCIEECLPAKKGADGVVVRTFHAGNELLADMRTGGGYDLLILDVVMPGLNGIELAAKIREFSDSCKIIFLTSSIDFAVDSYKVKAYYYLLKSEMKTELPAILERAADEIVNETASSILIKEKTRWTRIPLIRIEYIESLNHTVYFHLHSKETVSCYTAINTYHDSLMSDQRFIKCHKSFVVNMSYVTSITGREFILEGGVAVPISRNLFAQVKNAYFDYFFKR